MQHTVFSNKASNIFDTAILIKESALDKTKLIANYVDPIGINKESVIGIGLQYTDVNKATAALIVDCLNELMPILINAKVNLLICADVSYFKKLTGKSKVTGTVGYSYPCTYHHTLKHINVCYIPNYTAIFHNPTIQADIDIAIHEVAATLNNQPSSLGGDVIREAHYLIDELDIAMWLTKLLPKSALTIDIEAFSLDINTSGLGTIAFAWDKHSGIAFCVDYVEDTSPSIMHGKVRHNAPVRELLLNFFKQYKGRCIYHGITYDAKILIAQLFMTDLNDNKGCVDALPIMFNDAICTKDLVFLATNNTAGNTLDLKSNAYAYTGNYSMGEDIKNIRLIPKATLLEYNLIDCLATWYVYEKHYDWVMENQHKVYTEVFLPSMKVLTHTELVGMCIDMPQVLRSKEKLQGIQAENITTLDRTKSMKYFMKAYRQQLCDKRNKELKVKIAPLSDWDLTLFNVNSPKQLGAFLYEHLKLPILDYTKTKLPATGNKTLKKLLELMEVSKQFDASATEAIKAILIIKDVSKLLTTFLKTLELNSILKNDGEFYIHGSFKMGGAISARMSSSGPNLQNIPNTGNDYAKYVKMCFKAPPNMYFAGADYASLEDRISALITNDPNKIKIYSDGYDGHCLRTYSYFRDQIDDNLIKDTSPEEINKIEELYPQLRQDSKPATFALTYLGTWHTLVKNLGFAPELARQVEREYHILYKVSDDWVQSQLVLASKTGHVTGAFGVRLRTPILARTLFNRADAPYEAQAESRSAGNMLGQSYGLLNNRSTNAFMEEVYQSPYKYQILPCAQIHDAAYFYLPKVMRILQWVNKHLVKQMQWTGLPELQNPHVPLGGNLSVFTPTWANEIKLPNLAPTNTIFTKLKDIAIYEPTN